MAYRCEHENCIREATAVVVFPSLDGENFCCETHKKAFSSVGSETMLRELTEEEKSVKEEILCECGEEPEFMYHDSVYKRQSKSMTSHGNICCKDCVVEHVYESLDNVKDLLDVLLDGDGDIVSFEVKRLFRD